MERENSLWITFELNIQVMTEDTSTDNSERMWHQNRAKDRFLEKTNI